MVTLKLMKIVRLPVPAFMLPATAALKTVRQLTTAAADGTEAALAACDYIDLL